MLKNLEPPLPHVPFRTTRSISLSIFMRQSFPEDYLEVVKDTHETGGGFGSVGYGCQWKREEASKNLLRTHTTAVSSQVRLIQSV